MAQRNYLQQRVQHVLQKNKASIAKIVHIMPAPPLIYLMFDIVLPSVLRRKDLRKWKGTTFDVQFTFSGMPGKKSWVLEIDDGEVKLWRGEKDMPRMIINASARDFVDLVTGYLPEAKAIMSGRLGINGGPATRLKTVMSLFS